MSKHITTGQTGEDIACEYLEDKRFKILERNYRRKLGEIDIVARALNGALVFVEVKTLLGPGDSAIALVPEDHLTRAKLEKVARTCEVFVAKYPELVLEKKGWRIDLVAIAAFSAESLAKGVCAIRHYENIF